VRILIAEDEERMAELIAGALVDDGHQVAVAHDGETALSTAGGSPFDLFLLDIMLPRLDGLSLCRRLREDGQKAAVLVLTARGTVEDRVMGLDAGADDYLIKPFAMAELRARVRALARRPFGLRGPELRLGNLVLNPFRYQAWRGGKRLDLTAREFQVLALLLRHCGEVLSREQILSSVWGEEAEPYGNIVDQYVCYLRTKLERHGPRLIDTIRGVGYVAREMELACSDPSG
jgi:two-component system response regulator MprA